MFDTPVARSLAFNRFGAPGHSIRRAASINWDACAPPDRALIMSNQRTRNGLSGFRGRTVRAAPGSYLAPCKNSLELHCTIVRFGSAGRTVQGTQDRTDWQPSVASGILFLLDAQSATSPGLAGTAHLATGVDFQLAAKGPQGSRTPANSRLARNARVEILSSLTSTSIN